jgi:lysophospholipase L1-like esterase
MTFWNCHRCLRPATMLAGALLAAAAVLPAQAQVTVHAALSVTAPMQAAQTQASPQAQPAPSSPAAASQAPASTDSATNDPSLPPPKTLTAKAIDKVKQVAKSASDIFSRVPCMPPRGGAQSLGSLPHVANKLIAGQPVVIIAFGSSSTQGYGSSSPEFTYPNRLATQLKRQYPGANITVVNAGVGGEDAPEMMKRLQTTVIDAHPDLVIWQVGTNAVLRNLDPAETQKLVEDGVARIQGSGSDVVLVDPQYSPRVYERAESANKMVRMLNRVASIRHVGIFPRFQVMREWHENQSLPVDSFVISDGLHMNDWGYACFAQLLGDDIIKSVGQIKLGVNVPAEVRTYRPM